MILSLLVWFAMQGQVQACCNPDTDGPAKVCQQVQQCAKPAEHVIEIKTPSHTPESQRRSLIEITDYATINGRLFACPVGQEMASELTGYNGKGVPNWTTFCRAVKGR